jgi:hypothetical protein
MKNCGDSFRGREKLRKTRRAVSENSYRKPGHECCYTVIEHPRPVGLSRTGTLTLISILQ